MSFLNFLRDINPGLFRAIQLLQWQKEFELEKRDQEIRHTYMKRLIEQMNEKAAENYFQNQTKPKFELPPPTNEQLRNMEKWSRPLSVHDEVLKNLQRLDQKPPFQFPI